MKKILKAIAAVATIAMVGAAGTIAASAAAPGPAIKGIICLENEVVMYVTAEQGVSAYAVNFTYPSNLSTLEGVGRNDWRPAGTNLPGADAQWIAANVPNTSTNVILAGTAQPMPANTVLSQQIIESGTVSVASFTQTPSDLENSGNPITWSLCTDECCDTPVTTTPEETGTQTPPSDTAPVDTTAPAVDTTAPTTTAATVASTTASTGGNPTTGVALAIIPTLIAAGAAVVVAKKRK